MDGTFTAWYPPSRRPGGKGDWNEDSAPSLLSQNTDLERNPQPDTYHCSFGWQLLSVQCLRGCRRNRIKLTFRSRCEPRGDETKDLAALVKDLHGKRAREALTHVGEIAVDPSSGAILRLSVQADLQEFPAGRPLGVGG
jgi:hypothetical protein